jgi:hypothetical protein
MGGHPQCCISFQPSSTLDPRPTRRPTCKSMDRAFGSQLSHGESHEPKPHDPAWGESHDRSDSSAELVAGAHHSAPLRYTTLKGPLAKAAASLVSPAPIQQVSRLGLSPPDPFCLVSRWLYRPRAISLLALLGLPHVHVRHNLDPCRCLQVRERLLWCHGHRTCLPRPAYWSLQDRPPSTPGHTVRPGTTLRIDGQLRNFKMEQKNGRRHTKVQQFQGSHRDPASRRQTHALLF